jgi:hypothetical protein
MYSTPESVRTFAADMQKKAAMRSDLQNTQAALNAEHKSGQNTLLSIAKESITQ